MCVCVHAVVFVSQGILPFCLLGEQEESHDKICVFFFSEARAGVCVCSSEERQQVKVRESASGSANGMLPNDCRETNRPEG